MILLYMDLRYKLNQTLPWINVSNVHYYKFLIKGLEKNYTYNYNVATIRRCTFIVVIKYTILLYLFLLYKYTAKMKFTRPI